MKFIKCHETYVNFDNIIEIYIAHCLFTAQEYYVIKGMTVKDERVTLSKEFKTQKEAEFALKQIMEKIND